MLTLALVPDRLLIVVSMKAELDWSFLGMRVRRHRTPLVNAQRSKARVSTYKRVRRGHGTGTNQAAGSSFSTTAMISRIRSLIGGSASSANQLTSTDSSSQTRAA